MRFADFIKDGKVRLASKDISLAKSLLKSTLNEIKFLNKLKLADESASTLMKSYYDILRKILEAFSAIEGYKVYSHEAFTYFLKEKGEDVLSIKFERFRKIRNGLNYYGTTISSKEARDIINDMLN